MWVCFGIFFVLSYFNNCLHICCTFAQHTSFLKKLFCRIHVVQIFFFILYTQHFNILLLFIFSFKKNIFWIFRRDEPACKEYDRQGEEKETSPTDGASRGDIRSVVDRQMALVEESSGQLWSDRWCW